MEKRNLLYLKGFMLALILSITMPGQAQVVELLKDVVPGPSYCDYFYLTTCNGKLFFYSDDNEYGGGTYGSELWVSDGTDAGTQLLKDINPGSAPSQAGYAGNFAVCNNLLFFIANDGVHGAELWATNGTEAGTYMVKDIGNDGEVGIHWSGLGGYGASGNLYTYNNKVYFPACDGRTSQGQHDTELWCSDGTEAGTYLLKDIRPDEGSTPEQFHEYNGLLYFEAYDGAQAQGGHSGELWVTDGTEAGTHLFKDIAPVPSSETPANLTDCNGQMFFTTDDGATGRELWVTDGTEANTHLVKDIRTGIYGSYPKFLTDYNGILYFQINSSDNIRELWRSDGTEAGTYRVTTDIHYPLNLKVYDNKLIFLAYDGSNTANYEVWSYSDVDGIQLVKEINPSPTGGIDFNPELNFPEGFVQYKDKLYFRASSDGQSTVLWETDATEEGTMQTPGQNTAEIPEPLSPMYIMNFDFTVSHGSLYFPAAYDGFTAGIEVYKLTTLPSTNNVVGGGDYCQDDEGLPVGLSGSELGVIYTIYKDNVAQTPTVAGTGEAISFGNQLSGTYSVKGSNIAGTVDMIGSATINAVTSLPVSVSITVDNEEVCSGSPVTFTALPVNGGSNPTYQWYVNNNAVGSNQVQFIYMPTDGDMVEVELTSELSCAANVGVSNTIILTVNEIVTPEVSIVASENPVYSADPVIFSPTPVNGGDMPSYEWFVNDVLVGTDETYTYLPINEDQVYVVMTSSIECVTTATDTSNVIEMVVNNDIPAAYTVTGGGNYCEDSDGLPVGLSDSEIGVLYTLYKDDVAQVPTVDGTGEVLSFGDQLQGVYTVTGTNSNTTTTMAGSADIVEVGNLPVNVTIEPDHEPICSANSVTFTAYPENEGDNPTYQWYKNGNPVGTFNFLTYVPEDNDEVYVVLTSSIECTTDNPASSEIYTVEVLPTLLVEVNLEADNNNICAGTQVTFTATPVNGGNNPTYSWSVNENPVGSNLPTYTYVPSNSDEVRVFLTSDYACPSGGAEMTLAMSVNEIVTPSVSIVASENPVFAGESVTFTPTPENGGDTPAYQWYVNGNFVSDGTFYVYVPQNGDEVYTVMTGSLECVTSSTATSNSIEMIVSDGIPVVNVNPTSLTQSIDQANGQTTDYLSVSNNGEGILSWSATVEYLGPTKTVTVPEGPQIEPLAIDLSKSGTISASSPMAKDRETIVLNYDGDNSDAIGLQNGGTFFTAARFTSDMTSPYAGYMLESVDVYFGDAPTSASLKIWDAGTTTTPGTLLYEQAFNGTGWGTVNLTTPVEISGTDIWIGCSITHAAGAHVAGTDAGPAKPNGDWISTDGTTWSHLADLGYSYNWNIRANLTGVNYSWLSLDQYSGMVEVNESQELQVHFDATGLSVNDLYTANILINSNDPTTPVVTIPVTLALSVGIDETQNSQILVYPNPTEDKLYIKLNTSQTTTASLIMTDLKGQKITEKTFVGEASLDVSSYPAGIYLMKVIIGDSGKVCKIVIK